jgi:hypothetical protein
MATQTLKELLFGDPQLMTYAVLDGASVPDLPQELWKLGPEYECLYRGELEPDLAECAPYLVRLEPEHAFTLWVMEEGWGHHWGVFCTSPAELRDLRTHFRKFLMVYDPTGKPLYFRFYDPRVLRVYLPTCNEEERELFFGPIQNFIAEASAGVAAERIRREAGKSIVESFELEEAPAIRA